MIKRSTGESCVAVTFELPAEVGAECVSVCGEFNGWTTTAMGREKDGWFRVTVALKSGRMYRYRYLLDGTRWENDWSPDSYTPNAFGGDDSVVDLTGLDGRVPPAATRD